MHLLDTATSRLHEFQGDQIPDYAILSHRWDREEVSFRDMSDGRATSMTGFAKIKGCCAQAAMDGWRYVWIDSCCIDKSSSADLSEAINSMFQWYENAEVCYAYLSDVPAGNDDPCSKGSTFRESKWFTRGWTLQELLAPETVIFFNRNWVEIGTKASLSEIITSITGIRPLADFRKACAAQKMSWVSRRKTTREEDMAYCLIGLFGVNMPPLYGEGPNAFRRLQLEILSKSDDESIFAWQEDWMFETQGLLAISPSAFKDSGDVQRLDSKSTRPPFSMTNKGLRIELLLTKDPDFLNYDSIGKGQGEIFVAPLNCKRQSSCDCLGLYLMKIDGNYYQRVPDQLTSWANPGTEQTAMQLVYVKENDYIRSSKADTNLIGEQYFLVRCGSLLEKGFSISQRYMFSRKNHFKKSDPLDSGDWEANVDGLGAIFNRSRLGLHFGGALTFTKDTWNKFIFILDVDDRGRPRVNVVIPNGDQPLEEIVDSFSTSRSESERQLCLDRITRPIGAGRWSVSVSLRKRLNLGKKLYVIDITC